MSTPKQPKIQPSRELTLLEQAARDINARIRAMRQREAQRRQLAAFLKSHTLLTRADALSVVAELMPKAKRGTQPVPSGHVARVGKAIAEAREAKGLSRVELGKKIGRHTATVAYWETGKGYPPPELRPKLAKLLSLSPSALMNGDARPAS